MDGLRINEITPLLDQQTIRIGAVELLFCEHGVWDQEAEDERNTDPVTGVSRRAYFIQRVAAEIANAHAQNAPLCLLAIDITQLRALNERDGFGAGDAALRALATRVQDVVGEEGHVGRIGGDEIGACLPGHTQQRTRELAGAIESSRPDLRLSFGFAELDGSQTADSLVRAALDDTR